MSSASGGDAGLADRPRAQRRGPAFAVVLAGAATALLVYNVLPPLLPHLATQFGGGRKGELASQLAFSLPSLGWLLGGLVVGAVVHRVGVRWTITLSMLGVALFGGLGGVLDDPVSFGAARFAVGIAGVFLLTASVALLANVYEAQARPKMVGYMKAFANGVALPVALAVGLLAREVSWRAPFGLYTAFGVLGAVLALLAVSRSPDPVELDTAGPRRLRLSGLWPILVMIVFLNIPLTMASAQMPFVLVQHGLSDPALLSVIVSCGSLVIAASIAASGHLQARFGAWPILIVGVFILALGYAVIGFAPNWQTAVAGNAFAMVGGGFYYPQYFTLPMAGAEPADRARAVGLGQSAMFLGVFCNPLIMAPLRKAFGLSGMYLSVAVIIAGVTLLAIAFVALNRRMGKGRAIETPAPVRG